MKKIIIGGLIAAVVAGNLLSVNEGESLALQAKYKEQAELVAPNLLTLEEIGKPLNGILGYPAFKTRSKAAVYNISFANNNIFGRRELVIVPADRNAVNSKQIYGIVLGRQSQSNLWYVQIAPDRNVPVALMEKPVLLNAADIGKMIIAQN